MLARARRRGAAVIPFGGGTSVVGGVAPRARRLRRRRLPRPGAARRACSTSTCCRAAPRPAAGLRLPELDHALGAHGLRLGHLPQSYEWATVGGCAATRSAGQASTGFGRFDDLVAAVRCATPAGRARAARRARLARPGPTSRGSLLGSEGTLGVIAELTLRVRPVAEATRYEAWLLPSFAEGCEMLRALAQDEVAPDVARLVRRRETRTTSRSPGTTGLSRPGAALRRPPTGRVAC